MEMTRKQFLWSAAGIAYSAVGIAPLAEVQTPAADLLIKGGRVVDPSQSLSAVRDVAIVGNRIARVAENIPTESARTVLDARGKVVTPGLVDIHVHVYDAVVATSIDPDVSSVAKGATTVVDAGSAGANTFAGFRKHIIERATTRVYALLNISSVGFAAANEYSDLAFVDPDAAVRVIEANRDVILGIKVRMTPNIVNGQDLEVLRRARRASDATNVPIMVHIGGGASPLERILEILEPGDVVTHALHARTGQILDVEGRILPQVLEAQRRGIFMDIGHGSGNLSFEVAEKAARVGWFPDTISSDIHSRNVNGPVYDLATTLSKFLYLGMSLDDVIRCGATTPAKVFRFPEKLGTLQEGAGADVALFDLQAGQFEFVDSVGQRRVGSRKLTHFATVRGGQIYAGQ